MSERFFERSERGADDGLQAPDLGPLRTTAEREELAEACGRLADGFGRPLPSGDPHAPLARDVAQALTEAGLTQQAMNRALASVLAALGYPVQPFGTGGASLIVGPRRSASSSARLSRPSRRSR